MDNLETMATIGQARYRTKTNKATTNNNNTLNTEN